MLADNFSKSAAEEISGDGFTCLFGGNEAKTAIGGSLTHKFSQNKILSGSRLSLNTDDLKLAPLAHAPFTGQLHDLYGYPKPKGEDPPIMRAKTDLLGIVLHRVALEVDLGTLRKEALATFTTAAFDDAASSFGCHAGTETVLLLAGALGRLVCHFHGRREKISF